MFFFSEAMRSKVFSKRKNIGTVDDIIVRISNSDKKEFPPVVGLSVKSNSSDEVFYVPNEYVDSWGQKIIKLSGSNSQVETEFPIGEEYIYLKKSVLDKQIVDLSGVRVVRVNDLFFSQIQHHLCLVSIDISTLALLRRIGFIDKPFARAMKPNFLPWQDVQVIGNRLQLAIGAKEITKLHPADIANIIEKLNLNRGSLLLQSLDKDTAAKVMEEIQPDVRKLVIKKLGSERAASVLSRMSVDEIVDLIQILPGREARELLNKLPVDNKTQKVKNILEYDEDTAGGIMTPDYVHASPSETVSDVMEKIKKISSKFRSIHYVYIRDEEDKFLGVVSLRKLIIASPGKKMKEIMRPNKQTPSVKVEKDLMAVAAKMTRYNLSSIAVVNSEQKMLGVITVDDIMRRLFPRA